MGNTNETTSEQTLLINDPSSSLHNRQHLIQRTSETEDNTNNDANNVDIMNNSNYNFDYDYDMNTNKNEIKVKKSDKKNGILSKHSQERIHLLNSDYLLNNNNNNNNTNKHDDIIHRHHNNNDHPVNNNNTQHQPQPNHHQHHRHSLPNLKLFSKNNNNKHGDSNTNNHHSNINNIRRVKETNEVRKILLLGNGQSGKTTILKQLKLILNNKHNFEDYEYYEAIPAIRHNCINILSLLILKRDALLTKINDDNNNNKEAITNAMQLIQYCANESSLSLHAMPTDNRVHHNSNGVAYINSMESLSSSSSSHFIKYTNQIYSFQQWLLKIQESVQLIWKLECIQNIYHLHYIDNNSNNNGAFHHYVTADNMEYFFEDAKLKQIFSPYYMPSIEDMLNLRISTTGIVQSTFQIQHNFHNYLLQVFDTGGERNERKKWIHSFDNVNVIIFVSALNHFSQVLWEDERMPSLIDSINLFEEIVNGKWFKYTQFILLLNKKDLFRKQLKQGLTLNMCFQKKSNNNNNNNDNNSENNDNNDDNDNNNANNKKINIMYGDYEWNGHNYFVDKNKTSEQNDEHFELCYNEALTFIKDIFLSKSKSDKVIYTHVICAIQSSEMQMLFYNHLQLIIINASIKTPQLL